MPIEERGDGTYFISEKEFEVIEACGAMPAMFNKATELVHPPNNQQVMGIIYENGGLTAEVGWVVTPTPHFTTGQTVIIDL